MTYARVIFGTMLATMLVCCASDDPVPVHFQTAFRLHCVTGTCPTYGKPAHEIDNLDGDPGFVLSCEVGDGNKDLSFQAIATSESFSIELESAGSLCVLTVEEGNSTYEKECEVVGSNPSCAVGELEVSTPCQVHILRDGTTVSGSLCCGHLPLKNKNAQDTDYSLVAPTSNDPASFRIENCRE